MSEQDEDFAALFEASVKTAKQFDRGQMVNGTIVSIGPKVALVSIGGKSEAEIEVAELKDDDGDIEVSVGDHLQAMVVATAGGLKLSRKGVRNGWTRPCRLPRSRRRSSIWPWLAARMTTSESSPPSTEVSRRFSGRSLS